MEQKILTVEQVNRYIKKVFDDDYILKRVWIKGEVSNCKYHGSGHVYFTLKDDFAAISCVLFSRTRQLIDVEIKNGMKIMANGSVSVYEKTGQYQLYVKDLVEDGIGDLFVRFDKLKKRLTNEGLFSEEHKKTIPYYPRTIGIVTSETGAAIMDMINVAKRRNPFVNLVLYPSLVQGENAKHDIVSGIEYLNNRKDIDLIIIGRGGGSIEDLWPFNEEIVAYAIYNSDKPIISGVGHETDFTIADFVADLRAPTPSAAAELAIKPIDEIDERLMNYRFKLNNLMNQVITKSLSEINLLSLRLELYNPTNLVQQKTQYLVDLEDKLNRLFIEKIESHKQKLALYKEQLNRLSPEEKLKSGYAYIEDQKGNKIDSISGVNENEVINIKVWDGDFSAKVINKHSKEVEYE